MALTDLIEDLTKKHGNKLYLFLILGALSLWGVAHYMALPGDKVSLLGIIEYNKKPEESTPVPELLAKLEIYLLYAEISHTSFYRSALYQRQKELDIFLNDNWLPMSLERLFSKQNVSRAWDVIVREDDKKQRVVYMTKLAEKMLIKAKNKKIELTFPLTEFENRSSQDIMNFYKDMRTILNDIVKNQLTAKQYIDYRKFSLEFASTEMTGFGNNVERFRKLKQNLYKIDGNIRNLQESKDLEGVEDFHEMMKKLNNDIEE